jgi:hypothetical protein
MGRLKPFFGQNFTIWQQKKGFMASTKEFLEKIPWNSPYFKGGGKLKLSYLDHRFFHVANI